jgi:hypothetical protein
MQDLINKITEKAGISEEQATKALDAIKDFVIDKFPMLSGAVENMFSSSAAEDRPEPADEPLK